MRSLAARRRHPLASLAVLLIALLATGGAYAALAPTSGRAEASSSAQALGVVEDGRELFLANCATCHGINSEGTSDGPSLVGVGAASVDFQVGTGRMPLQQPGPQAPPGQPLFDEDQIRAMAAYIASLAPGPAIPSEEQTDYREGDIAEGGEIFRTNCSMCHNYAGAGGALTRGKYAPSLYDVSPKHIYEAMVTGPQSMPVFSDTQLPEEDKKSVIAYLKSIEDEPSPGLKLGSIGPVGEGLFVWVVGIGALVACAVWLGAKSK
ncbi:MAG: c-type cytochrome [Actinomycetota bacterium]|nr:c-type cytochrome [Actinomycetota bacterium]